MSTILDDVRATSLGRRDLRRLAFELAGGQVSRSRLSDVDVLSRHLRKALESSAIRSDIAFLSGLVSHDLQIAFNPETDLEITERNQLQVSESLWRRIIVRRRNEPWVFICSYAVNEASAVHGDTHGVTYGFNENVTTWRGIVASGSGSLVVFYNTSHAPTNRRTYAGLARVRSIRETSETGGGIRTWKAYLEDYRDIRPIPADQIMIPGRNFQHGIQAISWKAFERILINDPQAFRDFSRASEEPELSEDFDSSRNGPLAEYSSHGVDLVIPLSQTSDLSIAPEVPYSPKERTRDDDISDDRGFGDRQRNKAAEVRAVEIASAYMQSQGWFLSRDCQREGCGYDLEFVRGAARLHVEVKGIQASRIAFNMTAKEWHVCKTDGQFVLIAVTNVLHKDRCRVNVLWPHQIVSLARHATQYRFQTDHSDIGRNSNPQAGL